MKKRIFEVNDNGNLYYLVSPNRAVLIENLEFFDIGVDRNENGPFTINEIPESIAKNKVIEDKEGNKDSLWDLSKLINTENEVELIAELIRF